MFQTHIQPLAVTVLPPFILNIMHEIIDWTPLGPCVTFVLHPEPRFSTGKGVFSHLSSQTPLVCKHTLNLILSSFNETLLF